MPVFVELGGDVAVRAGVVSTLPPQPAAAVIATPIDKAHPALRIILCLPQRGLRVWAFSS
ncbi:hypothetical protein MAIC_15880 [Mycolicibacterium aichiense]|uniref:Uncharacterized protein n=1 Tax=Mycolicibacterium aichiense TaxID=1799 RepID=A0AAD1HL40_9MYCO|nr:hypothetical protein MAIC_15880 [Mycolicibacterium aichiense]